MLSAVGKELDGAPSLHEKYAYNNTGDLHTVSYNDGLTPAVTNSHNRLGQLSTVIRDGLTNTLARSEAGLVLSDSWTGGLLNGLSVTNGYDAFLRRTNLSLLNGSTLQVATAYDFDVAGRLAVVNALNGPTSLVASVGYEYLANSPLVENIRFSNSTARVMTTTKAYDNVNRLLSIASYSNAVVYSSNSYAYNAASQRTAVTNELGNRWDYQYDTLGQVRQGRQYTNGTTLITGRDFDYVFDDIGNRQSTTNNGSTTNYTANLLNQYTAVGSSSPTHDLDGNLTNDGRFSYTWDGENRLVAMEEGNQRLEFAYDHQGRRIQKQVYSGSPGSWTPVSTNRFIYDGWNLIAMLSGPSLTLSQYFYWGLDLSGSLQGAGGVGGLICVKTAPLPHFATQDGNGNVTALVRCSDGYVNAKYEYGPFGELLRATGNANTTNNPFRFSTKYQDNETGLLYYGYRYYVPPTGRWPNRDPIGERGMHTLAGTRERYRLQEEANLYRFVDNHPLNAHDPDGRKVQVCCRYTQTGLVKDCVLAACGLRHCWIKTDTKQAGMGEDGPRNKDGCCGKQPVKITDHSSETPTTCVDIPDADEECVDNELAIGKSLGVWSPGNSCLDLVGDVIKKCKGKRVCLYWETTVRCYGGTDCTTERVCAKWVY